MGYDAIHDDHWLILQHAALSVFVYLEILFRDQEI